EAMATARRWLDACKNKHALCERNTYGQEAPKRILEIDGEHVRLCERFQSWLPYACLSHCWGSRGPLMKLNSGTYSTLRAGVLLATLPKTFRDAAFVCRHLGIRYIWIDALCILQDSDEDWEEAAATMAGTYEGAEITIAATWSQDSDNGLFSRERTDALMTDRDSWPLLERAWVFQERKMSSRVLHFGKEQLFWECDSGRVSECSHSDNEFRNLEPSDEDFRSPDDEDPEDAWRRAVQQYSTLKLTYEKDRLPAISAYAKRMQQLRQGDVYIAGMWLDSLLTDLSWSFTLNSGEKLEPRPDRKEAFTPSWSWISVSKGV
ncbi:HET-domain-containing protein, partial [Macroventuria anomochaeta]